MRPSPTSGAAWSPQETFPPGGGSVQISHFFRTRPVVPVLIYVFLFLLEFLNAFFLFISLMGEYQTFVYCWGLFCKMILYYKYVIIQVQFRYLFLSQHRNIQISNCSCLFIFDNDKFYSFLMICRCIVNIVVSSFNCTRSLNEIKRQKL